MRSSNEFTSLILDIREVKLRFRSIRLNERRGRKMANETSIVPKHQNTFLGPMLVCHYLLNQMIFIRQTFSVYQESI